MPATDAIEKPKILLEKGLSFSNHILSDGSILCDKSIERGPGFSLIRAPKSEWVDSSGRGLKEDEEAFGSRWIGDGFSTRS